MSVVPAIVVLLLIVIIILIVIGLILLSRKRKGANSAYPNPMYYDNKGIVDTVVLNLLKLISAI